MGDLLFFIKSMVLTFIVVVVMQIKVGDHTLEDRTHQFVKSSSIGGYLTEVAQGAVNVLADVYANAVGAVDRGVSKKFQSDQFPGQRKIMGAVERSRNYLEEKEAKLKNADQERAELLKEYEEATDALGEVVE